MSNESDFWDAWNTECRNGEIDWTAAKLGEAVLKALRQLGLHPSQRVLDVGSGTGWLAAQFPSSWNYIGLELAPTAVELARSRVPGKRFEACDFMDWELPAEPFDTVVCVDTIAYFRDQAAAVGKMARALRPGGWAIITTVNPFVYSRISWVGPPGEGQVRKWLKRSELHALLKVHGLCPIKSHTILPDGDKGILSVLNSRKINAFLARFVGKGVLRVAKETIGLGQFRIVLARRDP